MWKDESSAAFMSLCIIFCNRQPALMLLETGAGFSLSEMRKNSPPCLGRTVHLLPEFSCFAFAGVIGDSLLRWEGS